MTKKIASQNNSEPSKKDNNDTPKTSDSFQNEEDSKEINKRVNDFPENKYVYLTPLKKIKLNIPMTPKKKRKNTNPFEYNIRGKNLLSLFQLVE